MTYALFFHALMLFAGQLEQHAACGTKNYQKSEAGSDTKQIEKLPLLHM